MWGEKGIDIRRVMGLGRINVVRYKWGVFDEFWDGE